MYYKHEEKNQGGFYTYSDTRQYDYQPGKSCGMAICGVSKSREHTKCK